MCPWCFYNIYYIILKLPFYFSFFPIDSEFHKWRQHLLPTYTRVMGISTEWGDECMSIIFLLSLEESNITALHSKKKDAL